MSAGDLSYEVELEISDVNYLIQFANNPPAFHSLVRRFLQNAASLTHLLASCKGEIMHQQRQREEHIKREAEKEEKMMAEYAKEVSDAFQSYYKLDGGEGRSRKRVRPICGDYLANVALKKRRKLQDQGEEEKVDKNEEKKE